MQGYVNRLGAMLDDRLRKRILCIAKLREGP